MSGVNLLKLVFYIKDHRLKVRPAFHDEPFTNGCKWKDKLEYIVSTNGDFTMMWTSLLPDLEKTYAEALVELIGARYPVSPHYDELLKSCPNLAFNNSCDEWVFYGGTFNPWHHGHQSCLDLLPDDKVCLVVPDRNPQKELSDIDPVANLLQVSTLAKFKKNQFLVPSFIMELRKNPTVEWIEKLSMRFPDQKLSLLMGFDSFSQIKTWIRAEDLLPKLHSIYVVSRLEDDEDRRLALVEVHARVSNLNVVFLGKNPYENLSSTELRKKKGDY